MPKQKEKKKSTSPQIKMPKAPKPSKTAQDTIPYELMYDDGMVMIEPGLFSKTYLIENVNFDTEDEEHQDELLKRYGQLLNRFNDKTTVQINIINRKGSEEQVRNQFFVRARADGLQEYRDEYNDIIADRISEGRNDIKRERYMTVTIETSDVANAKSNFDTMDREINDAVKNINKVGAHPLNAGERIQLLHDIFRPDEENYGEILDQYYDENGDFSLELVKKKGMTTKDMIAPSVIVNGGRQIQIGEDMIARTFVITDLPSTLDTKFLSEITNIPCAMIASVIYKSLPRKSAIRLANTQASAIKGEVVKAQKQATKEGYDPNLISESLQAARDEAGFLIKDLTTNNQKLFFATVTVTLFAKDEEEMSDFARVLQMRVSDYMCQSNSLYGQQMGGLKTSLPFAHSYIAIDRMLTTESAKAFFPFSVQELMDSKGHFYGLNVVTKNMIMYNRRDSKLANGLVLGQSGSGKSFIAKGEIIQTLLDSDDDIIILDPDGEYNLLVKEFKGLGLSCDTIDLTKGSNVHINPLDLDLNYAAEDNDDPIASKNDYLVGLCETIVSEYQTLTPFDINAIHKAGRQIYEPYVDHLNRLREGGSKITNDPESAPTLVTFYQALRDMPGSSEAHRLAMALEQYCVGDYNQFAHRTNITATPRFLVYDLSTLPAGLKPLAMKICLDNVWNRIVQNRGTQKRTWIYLDEFHVLVDTENSAKTLQNYWKRVRKMGGIMTGLTQDIEDVLVTQEGRGILNNSGFILMMNQSQIGRAELQEQYSLSDSMVDYIKDKPPGTGLLYNGQSTVPFNYKLPTNTKLYKIMSTNPKDLEEQEEKKAIEEARKAERAEALAD